MNYLKIETENVCNGSGLRVVLWVSGCNHRCDGCQNPQTWDCKSGILFDKAAKEELFNELSKDYISGVTFSGGDPLHENNLETVLDLINEIRISFPTKTIWLYTGYTWNQIMYPVVTDDFNLERDKNLSVRRKILEQCDILVDGRYIDSERDVSLKWRGSKNQRVIDVQKSLNKNKVTLYCD